MTLLKMTLPYRYWKLQVDQQSPRMSLTGEMSAPTETVRESFIFTKRP